MELYRVETCFFKNFSRFLKVRIFGSNFSLKIFSFSLRLNFMLNSSKTLKRFCKPT